MSTDMNDCPYIELHKATSRWMANGMTGRGSPKKDQADIDRLRKQLNPQPELCTCQKDS